MIGSAPDLLAPLQGIRRHSQLPVLIADLRIGGGAEEPWSSHHVTRAMTRMFGSTSDDLPRLARELSALLGVNFELHDSAFRGGDYYRAQTPSGEMILQNNYDAFNDELAEDSWPIMKSLLYLDGTDETAGRQVGKMLEESFLEMQPLE